MERTEEAAPAAEGLDRGGPSPMRGFRRLAASSAALATAAPGAHVAIRHPDLRLLSIERIDPRVIPDFRAPDVIRLGMAPS